HRESQRSRHPQRKADRRRTPRRAESARARALHLPRHVGSGFRVHHGALRRMNKLSAEDRLDIKELFAKYSWAIDLADGPGAVACFAEDAYFDHLWQGRVQGHAAILKNLEALWYERQSWWFGRHHLFN